MKPKCKHNLEHDTGNAGTDNSTGAVMHVQFVFAGVDSQRRCVCAESSTSHDHSYKTTQPT